jgi:large subunit ribosomal protein L6
MLKLKCDRSAERSSVKFTKYMSRLGKKPIKIPGAVTVKYHEGSLTVKGPKGELVFRVHPHVVITVNDSEKTVGVGVTDPEALLDRGLWGLTHKLIRNMFEGVTTGFSKSLELIGVGFKVALAGNKLNLDLGFSHPVVFELPKGVEAKIEKNVVTLSGSDKQQVGEVAAKIRKLKKPEPYKGKGIRYVGEVVRQKAGKAVKAAGAK